MTLVRRFLRDERGAAAIEYALIASFVALIAISGLQKVGLNLTKKFSAIAGNLR